MCVLMFITYFMPLYQFTLFHMECIKYLKITWHLILLCIFISPESPYMVFVIHIQVCLFKLKCIGNYTYTNSFLYTETHISLTSNINFAHT